MWRWELLGLLFRVCRRWTTTIDIAVHCIWISHVMNTTDTDFARDKHDWYWKISYVLPPTRSPYVCIIGQSSIYDNIAILSNPTLGMGNYLIIMRIMIALVGNDRIVSISLIVDGNNPQELIKICPNSHEFLTKVYTGAYERCEATRWSVLLWVYTRFTFRKPHAQWAFHLR